MSSYGTYTLQLRRERLERLRQEQERRRKEQVRQETEKLLVEGREKLSRFDHHLVEHFGRTAFEESGTLARQAEQQVQTDPDLALQLARRSLAAGQRGLEQASAQVAAWSQQRVEAQEAVAVLRLSLEGLCGSATISRDRDTLLVDAARHLAEATSAVRREDFPAAVAAAEKGQEILREVYKDRQEQQEQETVRREIVNGLCRVLAKMGFAVAPPCLLKDKDAGRVHLVGHLPSGRTATFEVALDHQVHFDLDGYLGDCRGDEEAIRKQVEAWCEAEAKDIHVHRKHDQPHQLSRNARDLPSDHGKQLHREERRHVSDGSGC